MSNPNRDACQECGGEGFLTRSIDVDAEVYDGPCKRCDGDGYEPDDELIYPIEEAK